LSIRALFAHFREMKHYFIAAALVFVTGIALGYGNSVRFETIIEEQLQRLEGVARSVYQADQPQLALFLFIFVNNVVNCLLTVFIGVIFGVFPIVFLLINGMVIGYIGQMQAAEGKWLMFVKGILPHGIIEIPAIVIAGAYGIYLGAIVLRGLFSFVVPRQKHVFANEIRRFVQLSVPLAGFFLAALFVAAGIESTFTLWLISR